MCEENNFQIFVLSAKENVFFVVFRLKKGLGILGVK